MKTTAQKILGTAVLSLMVACGNKNNNNPPPPGAVGPVGGVYGGCAIPGGVKDRTVVGNLGNGATLTLDIYSQPSGQIAAVGMINIPNSGILYGTPGTGGAFQACVSSVGLGALNRGYTYQDIELSLQGNGVSISLGSAYGNGTFLTGDSIEGTMYMDLQPFGPATFGLARP
jgi:hypothetical protein